MIVVNSSTRQFNIPGADLVFGVESDSGSVVKEFQCPRYVGNNLDLTGCFIRMNYRNANGEVDSYLVSDVAVDCDNVVFGWELSPKVTMYKGNVSFVMCVVGPDTKLKWHTTLGRGQVLEGLEPDWESVMDETVDVVAQLVAMVEAQTKAVADKGAEWVRNVQSEGTDQIVAVQTAGRESREAAVAEIEAKGVNVRESIPDDYTALSEAVDGLVRGRAGAIVCEAAGSAITVNDASDMAIQGMKIFGRSTQDGIPTPDAPVEIKSVVEPVVTVAGKNLLNVDEHFTFTGSAGINVYLPAGEYTVSFESETHDGEKPPEFRFYDNKIWNTLDGVQKVKTFTLSKPERKIYIYSNGTSSANSTGVSASIEKLMVSCAPGDYEPYKSQTLELTHTLPGIPVTSGGNYTDSDGQQWICDEVDLERGVYVRRIATRSFDGTEKWAGSTSDSLEQYHRSVSDMVPGVTAGYCNRLRVQNSYTVAGKPYARFSGQSIWWEDNSGSFGSLDAFKAYLVEQHESGNPLTIVYPLASPIETTLSETEIAAYRALHSNYPNTTVLNDAGAHMIVKYAADTKLYIDNKIAALIGG